jgi:hypothetical protein
VAQDFKAYFDLLDVVSSKIEIYNRTQMKQKPCHQLQARKEQYVWQHSNFAFKHVNHRKKLISQLKTKGDKLCHFEL